MKRTIQKRIYLFLFALCGLNACSDNFDICDGEQKFVPCQKDSFLSAFSQFDTAFFELTQDGGRKSDQVYIIEKDTLFAKGKFSCDNNCSYFETEILKLVRLDGRHIFTFSNNACANRHLHVNGLEHTFNAETEYRFKNGEVTLSLDSGLMFFQLNKNYILKRTR